MKTQKVILAIFSVLIGCSLYAQDEWEPRKHITGYINSIMEYSDQDNLREDFGIGLSEVGLLVSYQPLEDLELKATIVYTHYTFHVSQLLVEGYGMYRFNDGLRLGVGRFLTPLSPINQYFYAPLNPSGVVPMLVSHHFLFPQSISGFQLTGEFEASSSFKWGYSASIGSYAYINHFEGGIIGLQAQEDSHPSFGYYDTEADKINNYLCGTGRLYGIINDALTFGANYFTGDAQQVTQADDGSFIYYPSTKYTYGFDVHLNTGNFKINGEFWGGQQETTSETDKALGTHIKNEYEAYYGEIIYDMDIVKPFIRWDYIKDITVNGVGLPTDAATIGIAIRPRFETLLKLEYKRIMGTRITDIPNKISEDHDYNYAQFSFVVSF